MFRREMGSKRGSHLPKEGDLTCMSDNTYDRHYHFVFLNRVHSVC